MEDEIRAITLPADERRRPILRTLKRSDPGHYRKYIGGNLEAVSIGHPEATVYIHECGMLENLPTNTRAEALIEIHRPGFIGYNQIRGDVIIVGGVDSEGEDLEVPTAYITELEAKELKVPDPPNDRMGDGYDFMEKLEGSGWHPVPLWGSRGWSLGNWPYVCGLHYDSKEVYGLAVYCEGDLTVEAYETERERENATDELACFYWNHYEVPGAPKSLRDGRLGPYRG